TAITAGTDSRARARDQQEAGVGRPPALRSAANAAFPPRRFPAIVTRMKKTLAAIALAAAGLVQLPTLAKSPAVSTAGAAALNERIDAATARGEIPAAVVLVTNAEGVMYEHAAGKSSVAGN